MKNEQFFEMIKERNSTRVFDASTEISSSEITELLNAAMTAPSAWNLQHWKFVVFHGENAQGKLLPVAYNQHKKSPNETCQGKSKDQSYNPGAKLFYAG